MNRLTKLTLCIVGCVLLFGKMALDIYSGSTNTLTPNIANDAINHIWPFQHYARASVQAGILPLWNPYSALGTPLVSEVGVGLFYPLTWLIFLMEVPSALLLLQFLTVLIGLLGMYFYMGYLGVCTSARLLSSVIFSYSVFTESFSPTLGSSYCWLPVILWLTHRFLDAPSIKNCVGITLVVALCFLAGFPNFFVYTGIVSLSYFSVILLFTRSQYQVTALLYRMMMIAFALALVPCLVAVQLLPGLELSSLSVRSLESEAIYNAASGWENFSPALVFSNLLQTDLTYFYANKFAKLDSGLYYLGGALVFLPLSFCYKKYRVTAAAMFVSVLAILLFVLSYQVPALAFLQKIPLSGSLRVNGRGVAYIHFFLIALSGLGLSALIERSRQDILGSRPVVVRIIMSLFCVYIAAILWLGAWANQGLGFLPASSIAAASVLFLLTRDVELQRRMQLASLVVIFILLDVSWHRENRFLVPAFVDVDDPLLQHFSTDLKERQSHYRVLFVPNGFGQTYKIANLGPKLQVPGINAYAGLTLARWNNYLRHMVGENAYDESISKSINQRFYGEFSGSLSKLVLRDPHILGLASVRYIYKGGHVTENDSAVPRAYAVTHFTAANSEIQSLALLKRQLTKPLDSVILEGRIPKFLASEEKAEPGDVSIISHTSNHVELLVEVTRPSIVVLTDAYFPGWVATVDGVTTEILRANYLFRGVEVPPGSHRITFDYRPRSFYLGMTITLFSIVVVLLISSFYRLSGRNSGSSVKRF